MEISSLQSNIKRNIWLKVVAPIEFDNLSLKTVQMLLKVMSSVESLQVMCKMYRRVCKCLANLSDISMVLTFPDEMLISAPLLNFGNSCIVIACLWWVLRDMW